MLSAMLGHGKDSFLSLLTRFTFCREKAASALKFEPLKRKRPQNWRLLISLGMQSHRNKPLWDRLMFPSFRPDSRLCPSYINLFHRPSKIFARHDIEARTISLRNKDYLFPTPMVKCRLDNAWIFVVCVHVSELECLRLVWKCLGFLLIKWILKGQNTRFQQWRRGSISASNILKVMIHVYAVKHSQWISQKAGG